MINRMLILLSPAKTLDFETALPPIELSQPVLEDQAVALIKRARELSASGLSSLMGISDKLAVLNAERFKAWRPGAGHPVARPAILAFNGDVYEGLAATSLTAEDIAWVSCVCACSRASTGCCVLWTPCSLTGWKWAHD